MAKGHRAKAVRFAYHPLYKRLTYKRRTYRTQQMFRALEDNNVPMIKLLLKEGGLRFNARRLDDEVTLLHVVVIGFISYPAIIRRLVKAGCRMDIREFTGETALHIAVQYHRVPEAIQLIKLGANVCAKNPDGVTPLQFAVVNKTNVDPLEVIPNSARYSKMNFYGLKTIYSAFAARDIGRFYQPAFWGGKSQDVSHRLVKTLLDYGADVNANDNGGCSPLKCAIYTGDFELVKMLVDAGAKINYVDRTGITALHDAVLCCNEAMVQLLLNRGAKVNLETTRFENTALHWAAMLNIDNSHDRIIRELLEFGADLSQPNYHGLTPFGCILESGDVNLVRFCMDRHEVDLKRSICCGRYTGRNGLAYAVQNVNKGVLDLVLESNPRIDRHCINRLRTPLHLACQLSMLENVRRLISLGADVNAKDVYGYTPFYFCMSERPGAGSGENRPLALSRANFAEERRRVMRLLLDSGFDFNLAFFPENYSLYYSTVFHYAIVKRDVEARKAIIEHAAKVEAKTRKSAFDKFNLTIMQATPRAKRHHQRCLAELEGMKTTKIEGAVITFFSILTEPLDVVARYARNQEVVQLFETDSRILRNFPIYAPWLRAKFEEATARRNVIERFSIALSETLQFADPSDVFFENVMKYLNEADVKLIIDRANFKNSNAI